MEERPSADATQPGLKLAGASSAAGTTGSGGGGRGDERGLFRIELTRAQYQIRFESFNAVAILITLRSCQDLAPTEAQMTVTGKHYLLNFYDPVRLSQEIESELERGAVFFEPNLVIIRSVTRADMQQAAEMLVQSGQVTTLVPK